jgi:serine/threonine protein phosphatase PrpC
LAEQPNPQAAAERLRDLALDGGGRDNVTVLVVDFHAH